MNMFTLTGLNTSIVCLFSAFLMERLANKGGSLKIFYGVLPFAAMLLIGLLSTYYQLMPIFTHSVVHLGWKIAAACIALWLLIGLDFTIAAAKVNTGWKRESGTMMGDISQLGIFAPVGVIGLSVVSAFSLPF